MHSTVSMAAHSVENVPGSATVCFETVAVLMKGQNYIFSAVLYGV